MGEFIIDKLADKTITKEDLLQKVKCNYDLLPKIINGMNSSKAAIRYGCGKILMDISKDNPEKIYPYMDFFVKLLDSKYRILIWQSMDIIANLTIVDKEKKFDKIFNKYYSFIDNDYMVTVANLVGHSGKIALAKPYLINKITKELLKVEKIKTTPHLTEECKKVITEQAIISFDMFFDNIENKEIIIKFVEKNLNSSRNRLKLKAEEFLNKWKK
jgi:hypothetical protein